MPTYEHEQLSKLVSAIMDALLERAPDDSLPPLMTKDFIRGRFQYMISRMSTDDLLDLTLLAYMRLDELFQSVSKDWMMQRLGLKETEFQKVRKALEEAGIAFF